MLFPSVLPVVKVHQFLKTFVMTGRLSCRIGYEQKDGFNMDETDVFSHALPDKKLLMNN